MLRDDVPPNHSTPLTRIVEVDRGHHKERGPLETCAHRSMAVVLLWRQRLLDIPNIAEDDTLTS